MRKALPIVAACVSWLGCYHATIVTGATPSTQVIEKGFASGWIYGLVPPSTVETAAQCPNGVAKVETQLSFVNQLVAFLTIGIYTPMSITVTCAAAGHANAGHAASDLTVSTADGAAAVRETFKAAGDRAVQAKAPIYVQVRQE